MGLTYHLSSDRCNLKKFAEKSADWVAEWSEAGSRLDWQQAVTQGTVGAKRGKKGGREERKGKRGEKGGREERKGEKRGEKGGTVGGRREERKGGRGRKKARKRRKMKKRKKMSGASRPQRCHTRLWWF